MEKSDMFCFDTGGLHDYILGYDMVPDLVILPIYLALLISSPCTVHGSRFTVHIAMVTIPQE